LETDGDKGYVRWGGIHEKAGQDGKIYSTHGSAVQESERHTPFVLVTLIPSFPGTYRFVYVADLKATFQLQILGVKKNPQSPMYTQLGVLTKGTVIEINVSELGMVTAGGKVVFGKYAQVTNNPENDGCINAVLRASHSSLMLRRRFLTNSFQLFEVFLRAPYALFSYFYTIVSVNLHRFECCCITGTGSNPPLLSQTEQGHTQFLLTHQSCRSFGAHHVHENITHPSSPVRYSIFPGFVEYLVL